MARIDAFLKLGTQQGCSDVHLAVGVPPMLRMHGDLLPIKFRELRAAELDGYISEILTRSQNEHFAKGNDLDFSYVSGEGAGTGKSTTLAAMIDHLNQTRRLNIISLEDPIEFVHASKQSQVIQRELGTHIPSFAEGVRAAMREDPDVILVGELRDADTISMAMTAAETGHLVLGTLHTTSAVKTIDRVIDALPVEEREQTKSFLAQSLLAVVTQVLVKTPEGHGRRAICELLMMTKAIAKLIQTEQTHQIPSQLQMGRDLGMQLLDQALLAAITARTVDPDDAYTYAVEKRAFQKYVTDTTMLSKLDNLAPAPPVPPTNSAD
ncbi:MAG: type IV pili twitching motility protein PilT [Gammaproteobacteria bacterium]|nr:MAG: type IV pili twitching motility protein PilT [Gammaproteobacteria bacterium]